MKQAKSSGQAPSVPVNPLERLYDELKSGSTSFGHTVTERTPWDRNEFVATFPQGRRPAAPKCGCA